MEFIINSNLVCAHEKGLIVWSENTAEQLDAYLKEHTDSVALEEAAAIIRILVQDKPKPVEQHIYNGERMAEWWLRHGKGPLALPIRKTFPVDGVDNDQDPE